MTMTTSRSIGRWSLPSRLAALAVLTATAPEGARAIDAARQADLVQLVRQDCGSCHGLTLKGGLGKPLEPAALAGIDAAGIAEIILSGVPGTPMPPWQGLLSREDALWIAAALKQGFPE
jgi:cytochrome c55X